jgi:hypothetical protein
VLAVARDGPEGGDRDEVRNDGETGSGGEP